MLGEWLKELGHSVHLANNGLEGTRKLSNRAFDVVITDIFMGEKDGIEAIREMHHLKPDIPIIAISGGLKTYPFDLLKIAERLGATYVFPKPVPLQALNRAIQDALNSASCLKRHALNIPGGVFFWIVLTPTLILSGNTG